jgi:hypothetical protein
MVATDSEAADVMMGSWRRGEDGIHGWWSIEDGISEGCSCYNDLVLP